MHEEPAAGDSLVVVSQSWSHQMHPDPTGVKALSIECVHAGWANVEGGTFALSMHQGLKQWSQECHGR